MPDNHQRSRFALSGAKQGKMGRRRWGILLAVVVGGDDDLRSRLASRAAAIRAARGETVERPPVWMMRQAGRHMKVYRDLCKKYPTFRQRSEIAAVATEISLQPWNAYQTDGVILFSDILTPLPGMGVDFDILEKAGPKMTPIRSQSNTRRCASAMRCVTANRCATRSGSASTQWSTSSTGTTSACPGAIGLIDMNTAQCSSRCTNVPGMSPLMIIVKIVATGPPIDSLRPVRTIRCAP